MVGGWGEEEQAWGEPESHRTGCSPRECGQSPRHARSTGTVFCGFYSHEVSVPPDFVSQMKDMLRVRFTEWPRRESEEVREGKGEQERKSEVMESPKL